MSLRWFFILGFILEVWLLITWGSLLGLFLTLLEFVFSAMAGWYFVQKEGINLLFNVRNNVQRGCPPELEVISGLLTIVSGILLVIPGFASDILGIVLLLPWLKTKLLNRVWLSLKKNANKKSITIDQVD